MDTLSNLANAGLAGVAIVSIVSIVFVVKTFIGFLKNHMEHNTRSNERLANMIEEFMRYLKRVNGK